MNEMTAISRPRAGRPTREQAEARHAELLECALDHFLDKGFARATIEAIAADVGMTKRTVYARYADKAALFRAAVRRAIEHYSISEGDIRAIASEDLERTLIALAMLRLDLVSSPEGLKLQRIVHTESYRFPDLFADAYELGALPTIRFLAQRLEDETRAGTLAIENPLLAANVFMSLVISGPVQLMLASRPLPRCDVEERIAYSVRLFLDGVRPR